MLADRGVIRTGNEIISAEKILNATSSLDKF